MRHDDDPLVTEDVVAFLTTHFYIPETRGPMTLHPEQASVLSAFNERDGYGNFKHALWVYSAPKKSAKTTIGAAVALWQAWRIPHGEIYIIGNDLKQADNRMPQAIRFALESNPAMKGRYKITASDYKILLDNGTRIEAIPVDPRGEAGMNPTGLFWTEAWGAKGKAAELLWTEASLSPTRAGQSFKYIDSYAGFEGESLILERQYEAIVKEGTPDPVVPELYRRGGSIAYWCTRRYLDWQTSEAAQAYYAQEAIDKSPSEFDRVHNNKWQSATESFVPIEWWDACKGALTPLRRNQEIVLAADAGVASDNFALKAVTRDGDMTQVRYVRIWQPPPGGKIIFGDPDNPDNQDYPEGEIIRLCRQYNVVKFVGDPWQLHDLMTRIRRRGIVDVEEFSQGNDRLIADKHLYDIIRERRIVWDESVPRIDELRQHIANANKKTEGDKLRIVKRDAKLKIDGAVCLSMAAHTAKRLNLG